MGIRSLRERGGADFIKGDLSSRKIMDYIIITICTYIHVHVHFRTYMHAYVVNTRGVTNK